MLTEFSPWVGTLLTIGNIIFFVGVSINKLWTVDKNHAKMRKDLKELAQATHEDLKELTQATHANASFSKVLAESHELLAKQTAKNHESMSQEIKELTKVVNGLCVSLARVDNRREHVCAVG